jgi:hypothetical protein
VREAPNARRDLTLSVRSLEDARSFQWRKLLARWGSDGLGHLRERLLRRPERPICFRHQVPRLWKRRLAVLDEPADVVEMTV